VQSGIDLRRGTLRFYAGLNLRFGVPWLMRSRQRRSFARNGLAARFNHTLEGLGRAVIWNAFALES